MKLAAVRDSSRLSGGTSSHLLSLVSLLHIHLHISQRMEGSFFLFFAGCRLERLGMQMNLFSRSEKVKKKKLFSFQEKKMLFLPRMHSGKEAKEKKLTPENFLVNFFLLPGSFRAKLRSRTHAKKKKDSVAGQSVSRMKRKSGRSTKRSKKCRGREKSTRGH